MRKHTVSDWQNAAMFCLKGINDSPNRNVVYCKPYVYGV